MGITRARVAAAVSLGLVAGCASPSSTGEAATQDAGFFGNVIRQAEDGGASEQQLAILRQAEADGVLDIEATRAAARATVQCLQNDGLGAEYLESVDDTGEGLPTYRVAIDSARSQAEQDEILQSCEDAEFTWVNMAYQTQPATQDAKIDYVNSQESVLRACLEGAGVQTDPDATGYELALQAIQMPGNEGTDCISDAGITSF